MSDKGLIFDIRKFSIHDGPGIRTAIFFKGCPLSCQWCHNPESQSPKQELILRPNRCIRCGACEAACAEGAIALGDDAALTNRDKCTLCGDCIEVCYAEGREMVGREMTVAQVMAEIEHDVPFFDESGGGVTFSGGEPLQQKSFLLALVRACKEKGIHTTVDTCGFATWESFDSVRPFVDLFLYDLKLMDDTRHQEFTGVSNALILQNLQRLSALKHNIFIRIPIIPGVNDDEENLRQLGTFAASLPCASRIDILPYHHAGIDKYDRLHKPYELPETRPPSDERMSEIRRGLESFNLQVKIGG